MVCEVSGWRIPWTKPTDIEFDDAVKVLTSKDAHDFSGHVSQSFFFEWSFGRLIARADGSVTFVAQGIEATDASRLLDKGDGSPLAVDEIHGYPYDTRRLRIANCVRFGVFVVLVLYPLPWVWINPNGTRK